MLFCVSRPAHKRRNVIVFVSCMFADLDLTDMNSLEEMPVGEGFCGGQCRPNSRCFVDIYMGVEECLCTRGHYLREPESADEVEECVPCRIHSYKSGIGNYPCTLCPNPMFSNNTGNIDVSACQCPIDVINQGREDTECIGELLSLVVLYLSSRLGLDVSFNVTIMRHGRKKISL